MNVKCFVSVLCISFMAIVGAHADDTNPVLGKLGDFVIRELDLDRLLASQPQEVQKQLQENPQGRIGLVRSILLEKAIAAKAKKDGFDKKPDIREQLNYIYDSFLSKEYLTKVVIANVTVSVEDTKKYYQEHLKDFVIPEKITVRHIFVEALKDAPVQNKDKARSKAEVILQRLKKGEEFAKLAKELSEDESTAQKGGDLGVMTRGKTNSEDFEKVAFSLKTGEISGIETSEFGYHIIKVDDRKEQRTATFEEASDYIHNKLKAELEQKKVQDYLEQTMKESGIEISQPKDSLPTENPEKKDNSPK